MGEQMCEDCQLYFATFIDLVGEIEGDLCPECSENALEDKGEPEGHLGDINE